MNKLPQGGVFPFRPRQKRNWSLSPSQRLSEILKRRDVKHLVRSMPIPDLYAFIQRLGLNDSIPLLALASGEQIQQMTDMEVWERDQLSPPRFITWMEAVLAGDPKNIKERVRALDPELLQTLLTQHLRVFTIEDEMSPAKEQYLASLELTRTPDDTFLLEFNGEEEVVDFIRRLLHQLYIEEAPFARGLLFECLSQLPSVVEESAYRIRTGRLEALGFVDYYEALAVFQPLPTGSETLPKREPNQGGSELQNIPLLSVKQTTQTGSFFEAVLREFTERYPRDAIHRDMAHLANKVVAAQSRDLSDEKEVRRCLQLAYDHVGLGLELLTDSDVDEAVELMATVHCERLFRTAHTTLFRMAQTASRGYPRMIAPLGIPAQLGPWPDARSKMVLCALAMPIPQFHPALLDAEADGEPRNYRTKAEVEAAQALVKRAVTSAQFLTQFMALGSLNDGALEAALPFGDDLTLTQLLLTALANRILGAPFAPHPLSAQNARRFLIAARATGDGDGTALGMKDLLLTELNKAVHLYGESHGEDKVEILESFIEELDQEFRLHYGQLDLKRPLKVEYLSGPLLLARTD